MAEQVTIQITENKTINVSDVLGNLKISTAAPTTQGLYMLSEIGTYTNLGGLVAEAGKVNYAYFDGSAWSLASVWFPIEPLIKNSALKFGYVGLHTTPMAISQTINSGEVSVTFNIPNWIVSPSGNVDAGVSETKNINSDFGLYSLFFNENGASGNKIVLKKYYEKVQVNNSDSYYFLGTLQIKDSGIDINYLNINGRFTFNGNQYLNNISIEPLIEPLIKNSALKFGYVGLHTTPMAITQVVNAGTVSLTFNIPDYLVSPSGNVNVNITETKSISSNFGLYSLFYNVNGASGNKIVLKNYTEKIEVNNSDSYYFLGTLQIPSNGIDINYLNINGRFTFNGNQYSNISKIDAIPSIMLSQETDMNIFLPEKIYLIDDEFYTVFKESIFFNAKKDFEIKTSIVAVTDTSINIGEREVTFNSKNIDGYSSDSGINNKLGIYIDSSLNSGQYYYGNKIDVIKISKSSLNGKTIKYTAIGDSITDNGAVKASRHYLNRFNCDLIGVGLKNNSDSNSKGEGKSGWRLSNIIGRCNAHGWGAKEIINPTGNIQGGVNISDPLHSNPFIRLATATEKQNYGDWCFTNTSASASSANYLEKSYNQIVSEGGNINQDFFIFDIDNYYRTQHNWSGSGNPVDAISVAFSTNELIIEAQGLGDSSLINSAITRYEQNLEWFLTRIKNQLPNVKVAVIPSYSWAKYNWGIKYYDYILPMIMRIFNKVNAINQTLNTNYVTLAPYLYMDRMYSYNRDNIIESQKINNSTANKYKIADDIHFDSIGYMQYTKSISGWLANI